MSLKRRNGCLYYYRNRKVGGKVVSEYVASGHAAYALAQSDLKARLDTQEARREALEQIDAEIREDAWIQAEVEDRLAVIEAHLLALGYHRPGRWKWRRRRRGGEGPGAGAEGTGGRRGRAGRSEEDGQSEGDPAR